MLKRYASAQRIHWVGRVWEIRRALQQEMKKTGGNTPVAKLLAPDSSRNRKMAQDRCATPLRRIR